MQAITACSDAQAVPLSNVFEARMPAAASPRSAHDRCTHAGELPGPTAYVGLPDEYAASTIGREPVASTRSVR